MVMWNKYPLLWYIYSEHSVFVQNNLRINVWVLVCVSLLYTVIKMRLFLWHSFNPSRSTEVVSQARRLVGWENIWSLWAGFRGTLECNKCHPSCDCIDEPRLHIEAMATCALCLSSPLMTDQRRKANNDTLTLIQEFCEAKVINFCRPCVRKLYHWGKSWEWKSAS